MIDPGPHPLYHLFKKCLALVDLPAWDSNLWWYDLEIGLETFSFLLLACYAYIYVNAFQFWFEFDMCFIVIIIIII